jgi:hypothetical protein
MREVFHDGSVKQNKRPEFVVLAQKAAILDPFFLAADGSTTP